MAQLASALRSGRRGRVFESPLPDKRVPIGALLSWKKMCLELGFKEAPGFGFVGLGCVVEPEAGAGRRMVWEGSGRRLSEHGATGSGAAGGAGGSGGGGRAGR